MTVDPPKSYRHKEDGAVVQLLAINANDWYCWVKYSDGVVRPISEDVFFRDFEKKCKQNRYFKEPCIK